MTEIAEPFGDFTTHPPSPETITQFRRVIYRHYRVFGRSLPWRETSDPYEILVSEVMLQQTQVPRVLPRYSDFLARWPDVASLAAAGPDEVIRSWTGLGYNRRALALYRSARIVVETHGGIVPSNEEALLALPGVGPVTAAGLLCFAFGKPALYLETNVRRVYIHFFFSEREEISDREISVVASRSLDVSAPREWNYALMDYGVLLRKIPNANARSRHYRRQSPFEGSDRQIRGRIVAYLLERGLASPADVVTDLPFSEDRILRCASLLVKEGMVCENAAGYSIVKRPDERVATES